MMEWCGAMRFVVLLLVVTVIAGGAASMVERFEYLQYRPVAAVPAAGRSERAPPTVSLNFTALGRHFRLLLTPDHTTLGPDLLLLGPGRDAGLPDPSHLQLYQGTVVDEPGSFVYGSLREGVFSGTIEMPPVSYYIEPPQVLTGNLTGAGGRPLPSDAAHSVIYSSRDVKLPRGIGCGFKDHAATLHEEHAKQHTEKLYVDDEVDQLELELDSELDSELESELQSDSELELSRSSASERPRRYISSRFNAPPKENPNRDQAGVCTMSIETDHMLWRHAHDMFDGNVPRARDYLISLVGNHMVYVNRLYAEEKFNGQYQHEGIQFQLQKLLITDDKACAPDYGGEKSRFCSENVDYADFLMLHSEGDHRAFCLAFAFTFRTFTESVMGFAWKASDDVVDRFSGVCGVSGVRLMKEGGKTVRQRLSKNCGIVSLESYGKRVTTIVSHLTLAHEIGHTLGSPHDLPEDNRPECIPGGYDGNYIMYPFSNSGYDPNNSHFSPCSVGYISRVLDIIANGKRRQCFRATTASYCGNSVLEKGEECDCGYTEDSCTDRCCYPRVLSEKDRDQNRSATGCARRAHTQCSASEGPCCLPETCRLMPAARAHECQPRTECQLASVCNGSSAVCPPAVHRLNYTECLRGSKVCLSGLCQASVCLKTGQEECGLTKNDTKDALTLCEVSCRQQGRPESPCRLLTAGGNSSDAGSGDAGSGDASGDAPGDRPGIRRPPGSSCDGAHGYCDVFGRCRPYRERGPLAAVHRLLFTGEGRADLFSWLQYRWWAVLLIVVLMVLVMMVTVRCCVVHTPSSNPRRPPARPLKDTARRPISALGLPPADQVKCWGRAAAADPDQQEPSSSAPSAAPSAPSIPVINDADAWSKTSSFEHLSQAALPGQPVGGRPAPLTEAALPGQPVGGRPAPLTEAALPGQPVGGRPAPAPLTQVDV